jgi:4-hydroxythreonine-4-phosphate dehydrogenase
MTDWNTFTIQRPEQANPKQVNIINCWDNPQQEIQPGQVTEDAGNGAFESLKRATEDLKAGKIDALITAPINKQNIQREDFKFVGHTEYLADAFGVKDALMFLVSDTLRVAVVTGHLPIEKVKQKITKELVIKKIEQVSNSLKKDFGISRPKIAVLGLNPHAGDNGVIGTEEMDIIQPAIIEVKKKGNLVFGAFSADGFFGAGMYKNYDAVLAMYHDQGLMPFKMLAFESGVNFTAALPVVRTSPDHGTAYDIAGKNVADENSLIQAIYTAIDVAKYRKEQAELTANALKKKGFVLEKD